MHEVNRVTRPKEAADALGFATATLQKYARKGIIPSDVTAGGHHRFDVEEVREVLNARRPDGPRRMQLYVWEGVLRDYTAGMIVALAPDLDAALSLVREHDNRVAQEMGGNTPATVITMVTDAGPRVWYAYGGG